MANSLDLTALANALGDYNRSNGQILLKQVFKELARNMRVNVLTNIKDEEPLVVPSIGQVLQPGNPEAWNPTSNAFSINGRILKVRDWKVDLSIYPQLIAKQFIGRLQPPGSNPYLLDRTLESILMMHLYKQVEHDLGNAFWNGVYNAAAVGANAADPVRIIDGVRQLITADLALVTPNLTAVTTGAISSANAVPSLESMWQALDDSLKVEGAKMYMAPSIYEAYNVNYRNTHGDTAYNREFGKRFLEVSEGLCELVPIQHLAGSGRVILDPVGVIYMGTDLLADNEGLIVEQEKRALNLLMDGKIGCQFAAFQVNSVEYLVVNDQA